MMLMKTYIMRLGILQLFRFQMATKQNEIYRIARTNAFQVYEYK